MTLLPSTYTAEAVQKLTEFAPDAFCVADSNNDGIPLPTLRYPPDLNDDADRRRPAKPFSQLFDVPQIDAQRVVAYVFTSGSTGVPVPHRKNWGRLVHCVEVAMAALGLDVSRPCTLIGTVPPQHMFGFGSTVLLALIGGQAFDAGRPLLSGRRAHRHRGRAASAHMLVSTPVHLRSLLTEASTPARRSCRNSTSSPVGHCPALARVGAAGRRSLPRPADGNLMAARETGQIATPYRERGHLATDARHPSRVARGSGVGVARSYRDTHAAWRSARTARHTRPWGNTNAFALTGRTADLVGLRASGPRSAT